MRIRHKNALISFFIASLFAFIAGFALLHPGLPPTHDGEYHIVRFYEFDKTLRDGAWYPRWSPNLNYGFGEPILNFVYPFPNYMASLFHLFGLSFIDGLKLNLFLGLVISGIFMYLWAKIFWGDAGGVIASVFYTFSPYHFVDIYIRGSGGEVWALAWYPAFLWAITLTLQTENILYVILSSCFFACIIFSHNILALAFFPFAIVYIAYLLIRSKNKLRLILYSGFIFILGFGLSAVFWLPALMEKKYVNGLQVFDLERNFPDLAQLLIPSWGSDFFGTGTGNEMSVQIGIANLIVVFLSIVCIIFFFLKKNYKTANTIVFFILEFISIFLLMLQISLPVWKIVPLMFYFQFPWRFLSLEILIASFLSGSIVFLWRSKILFIVLLFLPFVFGFQYAKPAHYLYRNDTYYITRSNFIDSTNSPGNAFNTIWAKGEFTRQAQKATIVQGKGRITDQKIRPTYYQLKMNLESKAKVAINTLYFPGWKVFIDKQQVNIGPTHRGRIIFSIAKGKHLVEVIYTNTFIQNTGSICSIFCFIILLICVLRLIYLQSKQAFYSIKSGEQAFIRKT